MTSGLRASVCYALAGAGSIAAVSTLGDFIWANFGLQNRPLNGILHGALLFLCIGLYLGALGKKRLTGALAGAGIGAAIGGLAAGTFYLIRPTVGRSAMFFLWFATWIALGFLNERLTNGEINTRAAVGRGVLASVGSGAAFYLVSGIWFPFHPQGWDYLAHFAAWTAAYLPGFAALLVAKETDWKLSHK
jgi:hypothetical protein